MTRTEVLHPHGEAGRPGVWSVRTVSVTMRERRSTSVTFSPALRDGRARRAVRDFSSGLLNER